VNVSNRSYEEENCDQYENEISHWNSLAAGLSVLLQRKELCPPICSTLSWLRCL